MGLIRYANIKSPRLKGIYDTFDGMLDQMRQAVHTKETKLQFYDEYINPILTKRWNKISSPLHMAAYAAVKPK